MCGRPANASPVTQPSLAAAFMTLLGLRFPGMERPYRNANQPVIQIEPTAVLSASAMSEKDLDSTGSRVRWPVSRALPTA
jgi:hypothetical protein